ncbi:Retinoid isomerohydrolase-like protein [Cladobotryum mycophilum]|uniref:Retinoid isomerohydrolase-like protein n=1 Tax=Cladobotryum mycophilum TaxID=491253 RepID=A0ABR0SRX9_9HYPO
MDANTSSTIRRTAEHLEEDVKQKLDNWTNELWKTWPNEAQASPLNHCHRYWPPLTALQFEKLEEHRGPIELVVKGNIPAWAAGALYRTGPGESTVEGTSRGTHHITHWFDGTAHTHRFDIIASDEADKPTRVVYSSRRQSDGVVEDIKKHGWLTSTSFGQRADPCIGVFAKVMSVFEPARSNNNVAVIPDMPGFGGESELVGAGGHRAGAGNLIAVTDSAFLQMLDPKTLEPIGSVVQSYLHPDLKGPISCAHARRDPETGDLFNFNLELGGRDPVYRIFRVKAATGDTDILAAISGPKYRPAYIHSFFLTENYVILCLPSAHFGWAGLKVVWQKNFIDAIKPFDESQSCRWVVVDRKHGKGIVAEFSTPAKFFFHSVNAFDKLVEDEEGKKRVELCMDLAQYSNTDIMHTMYFDVLLDRNDAMRKTMIDKEWYKTTQSYLVRYRFGFDPSGQTPEDAKTAVAEEVLSIPSPHSGDLPNIHPKLNGKPYRYVYSVCTRGLSTFMDSIVKTDLHTREALIWSGPHAHSPGEAIFVPRPGATGEDDGVILSLVLDGTAQRSYLLCLDAETMEEVGRAEAGFAIAIGLHGSFQAGGRL